MLLLRPLSMGLRYSEIPFNFLQNRVGFFSLYPLGTRQEAAAPTASGAAVSGSLDLKS